MVPSSAPVGPESSQAEGKAMRASATRTIEACRGQIIEGILLDGEQGCGFNLLAAKTIPVGCKVGRLEEVSVGKEVTAFTGVALWRREP